MFLSVKKKTAFSFTLFTSLTLTVINDFLLPSSFFPILVKPEAVVWLGGVEKGGGGEGESSVQLFNNSRNSRALENSLKK